jgi:adenylate cyclase
VAEELGVRYVLEGSVRQSRDELRITAQLIDAIKGNHVWADRYDRHTSEIFDLQDEIAFSVAKSIDRNLISIGRSDGAVKTENLDAWIAVRKGIAKSKMFTAADHIKALEHFEAAIKADPGYAAAWALAGMQRLLLAIWYDIEPEDNFARSIEHAEKALALDPEQPIAYALICMIDRYRGQVDKGIQQCIQAIRLDPGYAAAYAQLAYMYVLEGRFEEALTHANKAVRMDPHHPAWYLEAIGDSYFFMDQFDKAIEVYEEYIKRPDGQVTGLLTLAAIYGYLDQLELARKYAAQAMEIWPEFRLSMLTVGYPYKNPEHLQRWIDGGRAAGVPY